MFGLQYRLRHYYDDVSVDLNSLLYKGGYLSVIKNYLDNSAWNYENGLYNTEINNDEFQ